MSSIGFCAGELYQLRAFSTLSKATTVYRRGGAPSRAVMLSVRTMKWPPAAAMMAGASSMTFWNARVSEISVASMTT
jgi:hypothetical protein